MARDSRTAGARRSAQRSAAAHPATPLAAVVRRRGAVGLGAAAVLLFAAACSSSGSTTSTASAASSTAPAAPTTAAAAPTTAGAAPAACTTVIAPTVSGSGPADTASAATAVATSFQKFFDPATPAASKLALLQNGPAFAPVLQGFASNKLASAATVTVTAVDFTGAAAADVTFNLCESGAAVLPGSAGKSVLAGGVWQVADATLCGLVKLNNGGAAVPGCS
ncbi:hypothetical protein GXW83_24835 [Streptacidiphilus sp. PB12-B1b]|uniref:hypothetical protein n=1 Tax=Streptacidiphilus sp. PB12-B1b TaxID=2705012 RepID=UPI0015FD2E78|nr:hypothetical protein [Streptacidiphilus sp. PB12-B1b]QMU78454.1 hypothetical protein GXW83_24835 [Streptacidiphilus sp. PB12-B1b]